MTSNGVNAQGIIINDPADRFDLSYVFANNLAALGLDPNPLVEMARVARAVAPGISCRAALVHPGEIRELVSLLSGSRVRPEVVIDFPDGVGGVITKETQAMHSSQAGAIGADVVVNIHAVQKRDRAAVLAELAAVRRHIGQIKVIGQIPYLWQFDRDAIPWLLETIAEAGAYCIKDWTTRENFLLPEGATLDYSQSTRLEYLKFMFDYIRDHKLPLVLKTAGRVTPDNIKSFLNAGVTLFGLSYRKAADLRKTLLNNY